MRDTSIGIPTVEMRVHYSIYHLWSAHHFTGLCKAIEDKHLTQDTEFEDVTANLRGKVIISRVRQNLPIRQRVEIWFAALNEFVNRSYAEKLFDLLEKRRIISMEAPQGR